MVQLKGWEHLHHNWLYALRMIRLFLSFVSFVKTFGSVVQREI